MSASRHPWMLLALMTPALAVSTVAAQSTAAGSSDAQAGAHADGSQAGGSQVSGSQAGGSQAGESQTSATAAEIPATGAASPAPASAPAGGVIRGTVISGSTPLPGVSITAANTLTGKRYATATDSNGTFAMRIPLNGRYVLRAEFAAFATQTEEVLLNAAGENGGKPEQIVTVQLQLQSRVTAAAAATEARANGATAGRVAGALQSLTLSSTGGNGATDASLGGGTSGAALPSLGALGGSDTGQDAVAISGQAGQTNGLANLDEDEIRHRVEDALAQARRNGGGQSDLAGAVMGVLGGLMGPGGGGGFGGPGGRGGGGRGGFGGLRNLDPTKLHGQLFFQGGNGALDATQYSLTGAPVTKPGYSNNRFGVSLAGSPYLPGVFKANPKQFVFLNVTGQRNLTPQNLYATVPTVAEREGDFSGLTETINGVAQQTVLYDPRTGQPFDRNRVPTARLSPQAVSLLQYYPAPNLATGTQRFNYQTITTAGNDATQISFRYVRNLGQGNAGPFGFGGGGGGGGRRQSQNASALRQNINVGFNYAHSASDNRNVFLPLSGKTASDGYNLSAGYSVGRGRLSNNASVTWNRSHALTSNLFTGTSQNPALSAGVALPSQGALGGPNVNFYNGLPNVSITNFTGLSLTTPRDSINQTISFSDVVSWSHKKHNVRLGLDLRRVHADSLGGNNPLGTFTFSSYATQSPGDQAAVAAGSTVQSSTGSGFADFLLGLPQQTAIQAGLHKVYLRATVLDWYANDDFRVRPGLTLNFGLRWEYFSPYSERNDRLVNLDHNEDFTEVAPVLPDGIGPFTGAFPHALVRPDYALYSPRLGVAWRPSFLKNTVVRGGYGLNFNTSQFATFAQSLSYQPPFAVTQTNVVATAANQTGCTTDSTTGLANLTLANGFGCSSKPTQNNYSVNKNYRLGHVQTWNFGVQRTLPLGVVLNVDYNGSVGGDLDVVRAPNHTATTVTTADAQAFRYEDSIAFSRYNALAINARKRLQKGVSLQATYTYGHSIDNASSIGGSSAQIAQDDTRLDLEESNSSFDRRHQLTGNWLYELPFGPNRAFLSQGGRLSRALDGFSLSGDFTFATGLYVTPEYNNSAAQLATGGLFTLRPDRVFSNGISGSGTVLNWFNRAAFTAPLNGYGTASRNSIRGPGNLAVDASLSRTIALGDTRSFEARVTGNNVFNTVQYSSINAVLNSATFGQVTSTAAQRSLLFVARYRF